MKYTLQFNSWKDLHSFLHNIKPYIPQDEKFEYSKELPILLFTKLYLQMLVDYDLLPDEITIIKDSTL